VFAASIAAVIGIAGTGLQEAVKEGMRASVHGWWRLRSAEYAPTDYLLGALVVVHLGAAMVFFGDSRRFADSAMGRLVRWCASFTFTLYLFHYPMLLGLRALRGSAPASPIAGLGSVAATLVGVWLVSFVTERQLPWWRRAADAALQRLIGGAGDAVADVPAAVAVPNRG
jgi:peptidoglycan/LPS O-acetylase OafA/YrhL